jgi:hypothetical protein
MRTLTLMAVVSLVAAGTSCTRSVTDPFDLVSVELGAPAIAAPGQTVNLTLTVTNRTSRRLEVGLSSPGALAFDVMVFAADGSHIWRRNAGPSNRPGGSIVLARIWSV